MVISTSRGFWNDAEQKGSDEITKVHDHIIILVWNLWRGENQQLIRLSLGEWIFGAEMSVILCLKPYYKFLSKKPKILT
jgi:hypothetical protein